MSTSQQRFMTADPETLLSILFRDAADLHLQLSELNRLRDQVRQAQRFLARSRRPRRIPGLAGQWDWLASDRPSGDARLGTSCPDDLLGQ
jgi:hypothetical protein